MTAAPLYKPNLIQQTAAKRTHMSRVDEYQILNGHYVRLRATKGTLDQKTPRSVHTLSKNRRQQLTKRLAKSNNDGPSIRSRSVELKRSTSEQLLITKTNDRSISPGLLMNSLTNNPKPLSTLEIRRIQLSQSSMTLNPKRIVNARQTILSKSFNYGPYTKGRSMSNQYERRFLDADVMDKNFYLFNQPNKPFNPRLLLYNLNESKVAKMRVYNPPSRRPNGSKNSMNLSTTWHAQNFDGDRGLENVMDEGSYLSESFRHFQREKMLPNALNLKRPSRGDLQFVKPSLSKEETEEIMAWNFLREVTENLIVAQTYTDAALYQIFQISIDKWKFKLPETKLKALVSKLLDDLFIKKEGALSAFDEPKDFVKPIITEPSEENYDYGDAEYDDDEEEKSVELTDHNDESVKSNRPESKRSAGRTSRNSTKQSERASSAKGVKTTKQKTASKIPKLKTVVAHHSESEIEEEINEEENEAEADGDNEEEDEEEEHEEKKLKKSAIALNTKKSSPVKKAKEKQLDHKEPSYIESVTEDESNDAKSFKEQEVTNVESAFDHDKSSAEATMGEVSDIEDDENNSFASHRNEKVATKQSGKQTTTKLQVAAKEQVSERHNDKQTKNVSKQRKYSWESSNDESDKIPTKDSAETKNDRKSSANVDVSKPPTDNVVPSLGLREDTIHSLNDETKSLSQGKPKERRRWWPSREGSTAGSVQQHSVDDGWRDGNHVDAKSDNLTAEVVDDIRKKREPFLQKLEETKSLSARSTDNNSGSSGKNDNGKSNQKINTNAVIEEHNIASSRKEELKAPVPAKRSSVSSQASQRRLSHEHAEDHHSRSAKDSDAGNSEDDDGVFDIPEDSTLRGDYGGRRLSQIINQIALDKEAPRGRPRSPIDQRPSLVRSPRISSTEENSYPITKPPPTNRRRNTSDSVKSGQKPTTIYEGDETNSTSDLQKLKEKHATNRASENENDSDKSNGSSPSDDFQLSKTTKVLKNALNTLALEATSDESENPN